ncbi:MAG: deoxyribodipyrimidine photo-lyase [Bryobacteraceae bacterium]|nr:deoxyribodipyrimidine photo-lyase [Bryobacteraceae bacterium]
MEQPKEETSERVRALNTHAPRPTGAYVLYWAQMNRRVSHNQALAYAIKLANEQKLPLLVYEGLTCTYHAANDRLHTFVLEGVPDMAAAVRALGAGYIFHLRRRRADANDALHRLAQNASCLVTDDYPTFIAREHNARLPQKLALPYYVVDASCIVPMSKLEKREYAAYTIRPKINRLLGQYLKPFTMPKLAHRWQSGHEDLHLEVTPEGIPALVASCEIDHSVPPSLTFRGGATEAGKHLAHFLQSNLRRYGTDRNQPAEHATSNLSPYLHFGHISALEIALRARDYALEHDFAADEYLEELIVRRELAFNFARYSDDPASLDNLPDWAKATLAKHAGDARDPLYTYEEFDLARTHDALWNAAQQELRLRGKIHGYYRMYWGKKIIEWSATPADACRTMVALHDRYALDGRDPNTYTGILWCFGLHDRPWTERAVFGMIRWMSYDGMRRKTNSEAYRKEIMLIEQSGRDSFRLQ